MLHYALRNNAQFGGAFTDLFILGVKRVRQTVAPFAISSDFTAAATTQTITLLNLNIGDSIVYPLAHAWVKQKFTDNATEGGAPTTLANLKCDLGVTSATKQFIAGTNGDLIQSPNYPITPASSPAPDLSAWNGATDPTAAQATAINLGFSTGAPYSTQAASKAILATLTSTAGNMNTITFGELWIYVALARLEDHIRDLTA